MYSLLSKWLALVSILISLSWSWRLKITFPSTSKPKIKTCLLTGESNILGKPPIIFLKIGKLESPSTKGFLIPANATQNIPFSSKEILSGYPGKPLMK